MEQQNEWTKAQKINVTVDLIETAKRHMKFLAVVDQNRHLYENHTLQNAIYRYNAFWLPLLAKHSDSPISEYPLVVPLDCEWIWHCHRLNPIRYKFDCEKLYGRILDNCNVISSVEATSKGKSKTEELWNEMYPGEPYELEMNRSFSEKLFRNEKFTSYDLISAVKRQISFTFQVSKPHMSDDLFLEEAEARYKGFLHIIRENKQLGVNRFCVPTYDVDLMWHTHQLHPYHYCKDMINILGMVLNHDDTDSDRKKGSKLETGFSETTRQWEETFGKRYWKAGAMYRGSAPTPMERPVREAMEFLMELVEIKNLPEGYADNLTVSFSKKQSNKVFNIKRSLSIFSLSGEKEIARFICEPTGEFFFELNFQSPTHKLIHNPLTVLGTCSLPLQDLVASGQLSADKWLSVNDVASINNDSDPISLHVSISFTPPMPQDAQSFISIAKLAKGEHDNEKGAKYSTCYGNCATVCDRDTMKSSACMSDCTNCGGLCGLDMVKNSVFYPDTMKSSACMSDCTNCGGLCGLDMAKSSVCGPDTMKSSACMSDCTNCGGLCGLDMVKSSVCGGECGGVCGLNIVKSSVCGGECGGVCGLHMGKSIICDGVHGYPQIMIDK